MLKTNDIDDSNRRLLSGRSRVRIAPGPPFAAGHQLISGFHKYLMENDLYRIVPLSVPGHLADYLNSIEPNEPPLDENTTDSGHQLATDGKGVRDA